jgi:hypothetical protein
MKRTTLSPPSSNSPARLSRAKHEVTKRLVEFSLVPTFPTQRILDWPARHMAPLVLALCSLQGAARTPVSGQACASSEVGGVIHTGY